MRAEQLCGTPLLSAVSPRNPFCVAWGGRVHRVVDVGHAEYRAAGPGLLRGALCTGRSLCAIVGTRHTRHCRLERHRVGTAWIAAGVGAGRVEAGIAAAMARPRGDGRGGGRHATLCVQPTLANMSAMPPRPRICLQCPQLKSLICGHSE